MNTKKYAVIIAAIVLLLSLLATTVLYIKDTAQSTDKQTLPIHTVTTTSMQNYVHNYVNEVLHKKFIFVGGSGRAYNRDSYLLNLKVMRYRHTMKPIVNWILAHSAQCWPDLAKGIVSWVDDKPHWLLLIAMMQAESGFNPTAVSSKGAIGLGQIMFTSNLVKNSIIEKRRDLFDPYKNITCMSYIFEQKLEIAEGDPLKAIYYYVGGKNKAYAKKIITNLHELITIANKQHIPE